ncbi:MAG: hypothetical protein D6784_13485 [Chloroflexi bacterium]|nr:MAG: hypothetical protein D6784_13485 [Chloroflexota bacterium]
MPVTFLTGPAGCGKTTYAVDQLRRWLVEQIPSSSILVLTPQQTLAHPYRQLLCQPDLPPAGEVDILTINGLARRTIDLFWPLGAVSSGFGRPNARPIFLDIEQAQYFLRQAIDPLLQEGYFDPTATPLTVPLPRLMSQLLDNLNKAALIGLPHTAVADRLLRSLAPELPGHRLALEHAQVCINRFRQFCLDRNLLDFSLQMEMFYRHLWPVPGVRQYLTRRYRYLIADNLEEDTPLTHAILRDWLPHTEAALLVMDEDAGYRIFLGANPQTAARLAGLADETIRLDRSHVMPAEMAAFGDQLGRLVVGQKVPRRPAKSTAPNPRQAFDFVQTRFYPQMLAQVVDRIAELVAAGTPPSEIVVLAPFVSDVLRFAFTEQMKRRGLAVRSHRPSRPLNREPAARTMLTLARLAFPHLGLLPDEFDVAQALHQAIDSLDPVRASLLTQVVYRRGTLTAFEKITTDMRQRITYQAGVKFDQLRAWLVDAQAEQPSPPLDHFFSRLFGEVLSQPGFGFHTNLEAGQTAARLVDSARRFRRVAEQVPLEINGPALRFPDGDWLNRTYLETIEQGLLAAQYLHGWETAANEAVLITPATTFLMSNRPVDYQFWLDAGSSGWWERIAQPLTHPYIMSATWEPDRPWTDADEVAAQRDRLYRLVLGLTRRCRKQVFIYNPEVNEQGFDQRGQLLILLQRLSRLTLEDD